MITNLKNSEDYVKRSIGIWTHIRKPSETQKLEPLNNCWILVIKPVWPENQCSQFTFSIFLFLIRFHHILVKSDIFWRKDFHVSDLWLVSFIRPVVIFIWFLQVEPPGIFCIELGRLSALSGASECSGQETMTSEWGRRAAQTWGREGQRERKMLYSSRLTRYKW